MPHSLPRPSDSPPVTTVKLCISMNLTIPGTSNKWNHMLCYDMCSFLSGLFYLACLKFPPCCRMCQFLSFQRLSHNPLFLHATFGYLSIHPSIDVRIVFTFGLVWIVLLWTWDANFCSESFPSLFVSIYPKVESAREVSVGSREGEGQVWSFWGLLWSFSRCWWQPPKRKLTDERRGHTCLWHQHRASCPLFFLSQLLPL